MQKLSFSTTSIPQLTLIQPFVAPDERGYLSKTFEQGIFKQNGIDLHPYEELMSESSQGVIRGLHFQRNFSQDKLVRVVHGEVFDVAVDLRDGSPTFGKWEGFYLSAQQRNMLYIPKGFAHGFLALEDHTLFCYLCGDRYDPKSDGGILWNDPDLNVAWPLERVVKPIVSSKDAALPSFKEFKATYGALIRQEA